MENNPIIIKIYSMKIIRYLTFFFLTTTLSAQSNEQPALNQGNAILFDIFYGAALPGGDLDDRFGNSFDIGGGLEWMTGDQNWIFGVAGGVIFGRKVEEDVLANLRTPEGQIIGSNAAWANIGIRQRGFHVEARFGKLIPLIKNNTRSGLRLALGLGLLQHKIRLQEDPQSFVPQVIDDYAKGYDRLTNGLMVSEFIGYQHLANNKLVNFYAGIELTQGFTKNRRDWDFPTNGPSDQSSRTDLLFGFKVGWVLPFYISKRHAESIRY